MHSGHLMFGLVLENSKLIVLYGLIGTTIVLSHFGRRSRQTEARE